MTTLTSLRRRWRDACKRAKHPPLGEKARSLKSVRIALHELMAAENDRTAAARRRKGAA